MEIEFDSSMSQDEFKQYIEQEVNKFYEKMNKNLYLQAKDLLNKYFGEENNQIVRPSWNRVSEYMIKHYGNDRVITFGLIHAQNKRELLNTCNIYIRFPQVTITNGGSSSHLIKDLWVKFKANEKFAISGLSGVRSTLSYEEAMVGYHHSHLPSCKATSSKPPSFVSFCTGQGEILQVMKVLSLDGFDPINFTLFCLHLQNFVVWESKAGVPHISYDSMKVGRSVRNLDNADSLAELNFGTVTGVADVLKDIFISADNSYAKRFIKPIITSDQVTVEDNDELSMELANVIKTLGINAFSRFDIMSVNVLLCKKLPDGQFVSLMRAERITVREPDRPIFTFKDQPIYLKIEGLAERQNNQNTENQNFPIYVHPSITQRFCQSFTEDFAEVCFRFEKVIKEDSLENLLQATGPNLLPV